MKRTKRASTQEGRNYSKSSLNIAINWYISVTDYNCKIEKSFNLAVRTLCWPFWDINLKNWHYFSHIINKLNLLQISYMILKHFVHRTAFKIIGRKEGKKERMKNLDHRPWTLYLDSGPWFQNLNLDCGPWTLILRNESKIAKRISLVLVRAYISFHQVSVDFSIFSTHF